MERPERYDPEDIEHLLSERPFHALLAEEKAYVLRHIGDAEEYERMRALLLHLRKDEQQREPMVPDAAAREQVMAAFRAQQQPVWRVWLNSIAAVFVQEHEGFQWRPALALAGVATVLVVGVALVYVTSLDRPQQLAEVVAPKEEPTAPAATASSSEGEATADANTEVLQQPVVSTVEQVREDAANERVMTVAEEAPVRAAEPSSLYSAEQEDFAADDMVSFSAAEQSEERIVQDVVTAVPSAADHRVVREAELTRNATTGNATGTVALKEATAKRRSTTVFDDRSRSVADDSELLALLRAGW
ncbi:MAG: hypothetical protein R2817_01410 [Flavobacteriales bacterium]